MIMATNRCFVAGVNSAASIQSPMTRIDFEKHVGTKFDGIHGWFATAPYAHYDPYLVEVIDRDETNNSDHKLTFYIIECFDGKALPTKHTVSLNDWEVGYFAWPSTVPTRSQVAAGAVICILMLNPKKMSKVSAQLSLDSIAAGTGFTTAIGKWPGSALDTQRADDAEIRAEAAEKKVQSLKDGLREALLSPNAVAPEARSRLEGLL
jgi:hypothetical protein